jgi:hypothetical protein
MVVNASVFGVGAGACMGPYGAVPKITGGQLYYYIPVDFGTRGMGQKSGGKLVPKLTGWLIYTIRPTAKTGTNQPQRSRSRSGHNGHEWARVLVAGFCSRIDRLVDIYYQAYCQNGNNPTPAF